MKRGGGGKEGVLECSTFRYEIKIIALHFVYVLLLYFLVFLELILHGIHFYLHF